VDGGAFEPRLAVKASLEKRGLTAGFDWKKAGWMERMIARCLKPKELLLAEFLCGGNPRWTARWIRMGLVCLATVVFAWVAPAFFRVASFAYLYLVLFLLRHFVSGWEGLGNREISGNRLGVYTVYPVGFWQLAWVMIKINCFRWLSFSLIAGATSLLVLCALKADMNLGLLHALKGLALLLVMQPLFPIFAVTTSTTDGNSFRLVLLFILCGGIFCGVTIMFFMANDLVSQLALGIGLCVLSIVGLLIYGHAYNSNWFDAQGRVDNRRGIKPIGT
jgi:hypothetical protein